MKLTIVTVLASALLAAAAPVENADDVTRITNTLAARNPGCVPFCQYPGDTCCGCCAVKREAVPSEEVLNNLKKRNPQCVPFCQYPGDTCCGCC
ncbi:uncharacterized protein BJX67DRAFT_292125 [Aspergillus lucknowensis]|uniref:Uncharacterized protein n=1 Tax=Aspergillus lucknowensis TaxID=176173 RepID=A0ABR4LDZ5_9EURO